MKDELLASIASMQPEELTSLFESLAEAFSQRAEKVYDVDPDNNGLIAQPYARLADCMAEASRAFTDEAEAPAIAEVESEEWATLKL